MNDTLQPPSDLPISTPRGRAGILRRLLTGLTAIYGVLSILVILFLLLDKTDIGLIELFKTALLFTLIPAVVFFLVALLLRKRWLVALLVPAVVASAWYYGRYFISTPIPVPDDAPRFSVLTFNTFTVRTEEEIAPILAIIREANPDIIALQELQHNGGAIISAALRDTYPYQALHWHETISNRGQGVYSKYPITADEFWRFTELPLSHGNQRVTVEIAGTPVALYNVHPWPSFERYGGTTLDPNSPQDQSHRGAIRGILERADAETMPVLLVGDFNLSDQFVEYDLITSRYTDSYLYAGHDLGFTSGFGPLRLLRVDYVFHSSEFISLDARVIGVSTPSDHLPLVVSLALVQPD